MLLRAPKFTPPDTLFPFPTLLRSIHCADCEPTLEAWKRKQPADVRVDYVPAAFRPTDNYARAAFAFGQMGVLDKLHGPLFHAIHDAQTVPISNASADELATFVRGEGIDADRFKAAMASPEVDALMQRARDFAIASGLRGTPTLIVDGKYRDRKSTRLNSSH